MKKDMDLGPSTVQIPETMKQNKPSGFKTLSQYTEEAYSDEKAFSAVKESTEAYSISSETMKDLSGKEDKEEKSWFKRDWPMGLLLGGLILAIAAVF